MLMVPAVQHVMDHQLVKLKQSGILLRSDAGFVVLRLRPDSTSR